MSTCKCVSGEATDVGCCQARANLGLCGCVQHVPVSIANICLQPLKVFLNNQVPVRCGRNRNLLADVCQRSDFHLREAEFRRLLLLEHVSLPNAIRSANRIRCCVRTHVDRSDVRPRLVRRTASGATAQAPRSVGHYRRRLHPPAAWVHL